VHFDVFAVACVHELLEGALRLQDGALLAAPRRREHTAREPGRRAAVQVGVVAERTSPAQFAGWSSIALSIGHVFEHVDLAMEPIGDA
jgi:hypothetical protein